MMRQRNVNLSAECCWLRRRVRSSLIIRYFYCVHVVQTASVSRKRLRDDITYVAEGSDIDRSIIGAGPCTTSNAHLWLVLALLNSIYVYTYENYTTKRDCASTTLQATARDRSRANLVTSSSRTQCWRFRPASDFYFFPALSTLSFPLPVPFSFYYYLLFGH